VYRTARTTPASRINLLREAERLGVAQAARNFCVSRNTVYRWRRRLGELEDRPCRPHRSPRRTPPEREAVLLAARVAWRWGPDRIGPLCGLSRRTAYRILRRHHMHRLRELFPEERPRRGVFVAREPGEVIQVDTKSVGGLQRGGGRRHEWIAPSGRRRDPVGWQQVHVAIDAASRLAYLEFLSTVAAAECSGFLRRACAFFDTRGITVRRVLTDNGPGYKAHLFDQTCAELGIRHTKIRPRHPWTNGRVERFNRTLKSECLRGPLHFTSDEERRYVAALWLAFYNARRPHTALGGLTPERWLRARPVTYL
jgi:transposase InsO family protein